MKLRLSPSLGVSSESIGGSSYDAMVSVLNAIASVDEFRGGLVTESIDFLLVVRLYALAISSANIM